MSDLVNLQLEGGQICRKIDILIIYIWFYFFKELFNNARFEGRTLEVKIDEYYWRTSSLPFLNYDDDDDFKLTNFVFIKNWMEWMGKECHKEKNPSLWVFFISSFYDLTLTHRHRNQWGINSWWNWNLNNSNIRNFY